MYKKLLCIGLVVSPSVVLAMNSSDTVAAHGGGPSGKNITQGPMQAPSRAQVMPGDEEQGLTHQGCVAQQSVRGMSGVGIGWVTAHPAICRCIREDEEAGERLRGSGHNALLR